MAKGNSGGQVCVGTAYAAPGAKTVMNGGKSSGPKQPMVAKGKGSAPRKGSRRGK